jgi:hypothetical protein
LLIRYKGLTFYGTLVITEFTGKWFKLLIRYEGLTFYGTLVITEFTGKWFLSCMHSGMPLEI